MQNNGLEGSPLVRFLEWGLSALGGFALALVAFRTKIVVLEGKDKMRAAEIEKQERNRIDEMVKLEKRIDEQLERIERRQWAVLRITADIAKKLQIDGRFSDQLMKLIAEEEPR